MNTVEIELMKVNDKGKCFFKKVIKHYDVGKSKNLILKAMGEKEIENLEYSKWNIINIKIVF